MGRWAVLCKEKTSAHNKSIKISITHILYVFWARCGCCLTLPECKCFWVACHNCIRFNMRTFLRNVSIYQFEWLSNKFYSMHFGYKCILNCVQFIKVSKINDIISKKYRIKEHGKSTQYTADVQRKLLLSEKIAKDIVGEYTNHDFLLIET